MTMSRVLTLGYVLFCAFISVVQALISSPESNNAACSSLKNNLGSNKVTFPGLAPSWVDSTTHYYSQEQVANKPACVVTPTDASDVQAAVRAIRAGNASLAVKAGGHNTNNEWNSVPGGVLIDLKNLNDKSFDEGSQEAFYQPGNRWGDLYDFYSKYNRTVVGGRLASVGSGLALGGGLSFLSAEYGLACDSFKQLDVVLANGDLVQARADNEYQDLFLSLKGGGNQFGIVVGYHSQVYEIGDFWGGTLIFGADQIEAVYDAALNFTNQNTDTKAAVIGTLNVLGTPSGIDLSVLGLNLTGLDTFLILFNVYDGPDGSAVFEQFTKIPHIADTRKKQTYTSIADMLDIGTLSSGVVSYRAGSHHSISNNAKSTLKEAIKNFREFAKEYKGVYDILSFDFQPVPKTLVEASRRNGGNAQDSVDGPYYWINYLFSYIPGTPNAQKALASLKTAVEKTPNDADLPIFLNDANADQPILQSYRAYDKLKSAKAKYDPDKCVSISIWILS